jgi:acetyl esterase/lipase
MNYYLYIFLLPLFYFTSCDSEYIVDKTTQNIPVLPQTIEKDVTYGDHFQQTYDLYLPQGRSSVQTKTLVLIHGGSWISGDKQQMDRIATRLQQSLPDYAIINMNYRLANGSSIKAFPHQLQDIDALLKKLQDRRQEYQINGEVALIGASAGAHLAALYTASYDNQDLVQMLVNIVGPMDFTQQQYRNNAGFDFLLNNLVDATAVDNEMDPATALSPALQVDSDMPPVINFYGNKDRLVSLGHLRSLENALEISDIPFTSTIFDGGHGNWNDRQFMQMETSIIDFVEQHF